MTEKAIVDYTDRAAHHGNQEQYEGGDKALAVIGNERVVVTAEEVRMDRSPIRFYVLVVTCSALPYSAGVVTILRSSIANIDFKTGQADPP